MALVFFLSGMGGVGVTRGEETASSDVSGQGQENREEEIRKALEKAENPENLKKQKDRKTVPGTASSNPSSLSGNGEGVAKKEALPSPGGSDRKGEPQPEEAKKTQPEKGGVPGEKESSRPTQGTEKQEPLSPGGKALEDSPEESRFDYAALENVTWETSGKKVILRLWISGQATPAVTMIRDQHGLKMRLRPKGLVTRIQHVLSPVPPGVQALSIREEVELTRSWGLEAPYYAVGEIQAALAFPAQCSLHQEPGLLEISFLFSQKAGPKTDEPAPVETIKTLQRETLESPGSTLGPSYQSQIQLEDRILYGTQKPPSVADLYKQIRENAEFKAESGLPENIRPVFDAEYPPFGSAEYFKKHIHGNISQSFDYTPNYNGGSTSAFGEGSAQRGSLGSGGSGGKDVGNILWSPAVALLFYHPGALDISTGYSASRDFPMMHNNFIYGLKQQSVNLSMARYSRARYAFAMQNNLGISGGTTRQKVNSRWLKASTQEGYQNGNSFGLNYMLSNRLIWGAGSGLSSMWSEAKTTGIRTQTLSGGVNTYFAYRAAPRMDLLLGTNLIHIFKNGGGSSSSSGSTGPAASVVTKGNNMQNVYLGAKYLYAKRITLTGSFQGSLIDWDIGKLGGSAGITYQRAHDNFSFQYGNSVAQNSTSMILTRTVNTSNGSGISFSRVVSMALTYGRSFNQGKTTGSLGVNYMKNCPLAGVFYGGTGGSSTISYDVSFSASIRRAILKNRASLGLSYSYEFAPSRMRNDVTGEHDLTSNTSQNITASMDYGF